MRPLRLQRVTEDDTLVLTGDTEREKYQGIRCPKCAWRPLPSSRWGCDRPFNGAPCWCSWNTFDTRGKCPRCGHQWENTVCLSCHQWSRHDDWYERAAK